jgi:hypothetical protein
LTAKGKRYAVINVEKLPKGSFLNEFSFKEFPAQFKGVHSGMFRDGMLDMTKSGNPPRWQTLPGVEGWSAFLNFQITKNEFAEIFGANGLEVFLLNGTLRLFYNGYYTDTRITVPPFKWMNLNFSVNTREGRIDLVSGDLLLGSYLFPRENRRIISEAIFKLQGKIDFFAFAGEPLKFLPRKDAEKQLLILSEKRLPDGITLKVR